MMKKTYLSLILIVIVSNVKGQFVLNENNEKGFNGGIFGYSYFYKSYYTGISSGYDLEKHSFNLGFGITPFNYTNYNPLSIVLIANYNFFPNGKTKRNNLFFDVNLSHGISFFRHTIYDANQLISYKKSTGHLGQLNIGFGFLTNLSQRLSIKSSFGLGAGVDYENVDLLIGTNFRVDLGLRF